MGEIDEDGYSENFKSDNEAYNLCVHNGIPEDQYVNKPEEIEKLEMLHFNYPTIGGLNPLTGLKELCIIAQDITTLKGLENCRFLEVLWVCETKVDKIIGLENCTRLKALYLYSNRISKIENLSHLTRLRTLWLNNNRIRVIEGLSELVQLESLLLASNQIERIGDSLDKLTKLKVELKIDFADVKDFNIANNNIGSFQEISNLSRLPNLKSLALSDLHFGLNPICKLCNYQIYVLYHLQQLRYLDTLPVSEEAVSQAESTYMKKNMYYNMRMKTTNRNTSNEIQLASNLKREKVNTIHEYLQRLLHYEKDIERSLLEVDKFTEAETEQMLRTVGNAVKDRYENMRRMDKAFKRCKKRLIEASENEVARLMVEMHSGGNVRLEVGKRTDLWFTSCVDLVQSHFYPQAYKAYEVGGIKVTKVVRIHNRYLRSQFEKKLKTRVEQTGNHDYKKKLEFLFYGETLPDHDNELSKIVERGYLLPEEREARGMSPLICLSNSVGEADRSRLEYLSKPENREEARKNKYSGRLMIVKTFIDKKASLSDLGIGKTAQINYHRHFNDVDSVYKTKNRDSKRTLYYIVDNAICLPEYIVYYEYYPSHLTSIMDKVSPTAVTPLDRSHDPLLTEFSQIMQEFDSELKTLLRNEGKLDLFNVDSSLITPRDPVFKITEEVIMKESHSTTFSTITYLNLHSSKIQKIENLSLLVNLATLILSFNDISKVEGLSDLRNLVTLDLSHNKISKLEGTGFRGLLELKNLDVSYNNISKLDDLVVLAKCIPELIDLNLLRNPVTELKGYRITTLRRLTLLKILDCSPVTEEEKKEAKDEVNSLTTKILIEHSFSNRKNENDVHAFNEIKSAVAEGGTVSEEWYAQVVDLELRHQGIRKIQNLEKLPNLRRLFLSDNQVYKIEGLEGNTRLEELILEENYISKLEGMTSLANLTRLDLGKNQIVFIENLSHLVNLTQLSLEDNGIASLRGLESLANLMELYIGNNKIADIRDVLNLRNLPKLIILDLAGNPLCISPNYRLYVIYRLSRLKVLDGISIDTEEQNASKDQYFGRLNLEFLEERLGTTSFDQSKEMSICGARIKEIDTLSGILFKNLRELTLENNSITSIRGLSELSNLVVLKLNHNKIENFDDIFSLKISF